MNNQIPEKWSTLKEVQEYLGIRRETILQWIAKRDMPAYKMRKLWKFKLSVDQTENLFSNGKNMNVRRSAESARKQESTECCNDSRDHRNVGAARESADLQYNMPEIFVNQEAFQ